jgi:hypothetical protein
MKSANPTLPIRIDFSPFSPVFSSAFLEKE